MTVDQNYLHLKQITLWEEMNTQGLRSDQLVEIFGIAITAIEQRSLLTLSGITVQVVMDRVLQESREKFPLLIDVEFISPGYNFNHLYSKSEQYKNEEIRNALRYLLAEFLNILGNITANVLISPLHKTLMEVTRERSLMFAEVQNLHPIKTGRGES